MHEVRLRSSSLVERVASVGTVVVVVAAQIAAGLGALSWWVGGAVAVLAFAIWTAVHVNALDRPRVGGVAAALLAAFTALSVVVALFWRSANSPATGVVVVFAIIAVVPLIAYFLSRR